MPFRPTRRAVLAATAAVAALPALPAIAAPRRLRAAPGEAQLAPAGYGATGVWAYEGVAPGPEIRVAQGARILARLENALPQPTTIHWHGVRIDNAMDGAAGLTQTPVVPGGEFLYDFAVPDAGTYWYHSHNRSWEQMARGLHGPLIVEEAAPPETDADLALVIDDWRLEKTGAIAEDFGALHDWAHAGRIGNWITVNGKGDWSRPSRKGERLRLRLINAANARVFTLSLKGMSGWIVALDGQPLDAPDPAGRMTLAPAQRIDLAVDIEDPGEALLVTEERDGAYALASFPVDGVLRDAPLPPPAALPPNPVPPLGPLEEAHRVDLRLEGGAMGGMRTAKRGDGREGSFQELASEGLVWAMNGIAGMPEAPLFDVPRGRTVRVRMINDTAWPHAMHLHGHHFRRIGPEGPGPLRDTLLVARGETVEIALHADNPGDWLIHCHMVEHMAGGMMAWFRVA